MKTRTLFALALCLGLAGTVLAQTTRYGDPNFVRQNDWQSGMPTVLRLSTTAEVGHEFDGTPVEIPFTITGTRARVWLAVYSKDANPQYGGAPFGQGGVGNAMLRAAGLDTMIRVTAGEAFSEGSHTIAWDGMDFHGNPVQAGSYDFFLIALDDVSKPTWTGDAPSPSMWGEYRFDFRFDPPIIWSTRSNPARLTRTPVGTDLFEDPNPQTHIQMPWMAPRRQELYDESVPSQWELSFIEIEPNDPNIAYVGNMGWPGANDLPPGIWKVEIDLDELTIVPDETWEHSDRGYIVWEDRLPKSALRRSPHNPWNEDDGLIYLSWMNREPPLTPGVLIFDRATGELVTILDLTDLYLLEHPERGPGTPGPFGIDVDDTGIYLSSYWMDTPGSWPAKLSFEGDLIWQNQDGDGFVDRYWGEEAEARGILPLDQMVHTHQFATRWGFSVGGGYNDPSWGFLLGPDGSGIIKFDLPHMPPALGGGVKFVTNDTDFDGLWIPMDNSQLVHWPFDMAHGVITEGPPTAVLEVESALPDDFALGAAYPNPFNSQTAIRFSIAEAGQGVTTTLRIFNTAGQQVATLVDEVMQPGTYEATWDGRDQAGLEVGSGTYLYRLTVGDHFNQTQRMTLLK